MSVVAASKKSWKTTTLGILGVVTIVAAAATQLLRGEPVDLATIIPALLASIAALFAKDADQTGLPPAPPPAP